MVPEQQRSHRFCVRPDYFGRLERGRALSGSCRETAASCILAFEPLWYKTERLRDPSRLGSELIAQTVV